MDVRTVTAEKEQCEHRADCERRNGHPPICMKVVDGQWQVLPQSPGISVVHSEHWR